MKSYKKYRSSKWTKFKTKPKKTSKVLNKAHKFTLYTLLPGGRVLPIMAYTGRLHTKGSPFSGFWYMKG